MKGIVKIEEEKERKVVINGVKKILNKKERMKKWKKGKREKIMVMIVKELKEEYVREILDEFMGRKGIERKEREEMNENKMEIKGL